MSLLEYKPSVLVYGDSNTWGYKFDYKDGESKRFPHENRWTTITGEYLLNKVHIIAEGLNGRTTVYDDDFGDYNCNGRLFLPCTLHTHNPLRVVIIALGTNDLKTNHAKSAAEIVDGIKTIVNDVKKADFIGDHVPNEDGTLSYKQPEILVLGPPVIHSTAWNKPWNIPVNAEEMSTEVSARLVSECKEWNVHYLNLGDVASVSPIDGVHFTLDSQPLIARAVADKLTEILSL